MGDRPGRLADIAGLETAGMSEAQKANLFIEKIKELNKLLNIPEHLEVQEKDIPTIAQRANKEGNPLYPVPKVMDVEELSAIIRKVGNI